MKRLFVLTPQARADLQDVSGSVPNSSNNSRNWDARPEWDRKLARTTAVQRLHPVRLTASDVIRREHHALQHPNLAPLPLNTHHARSVPVCWPVGPQAFAGRRPTFQIGQLRSHQLGYVRHARMSLAIIGLGLCGRRKRIGERGGGHDRRSERERRLAPKFREGSGAASYAQWRSQKLQDPQHQLSRACMNLSAGPNFPKNLQP